MNDNVEIDSGGGWCWSAVPSANECEKVDMLEKTINDLVEIEANMTFYKHPESAKVVRDDIELLKEKQPVKPIQFEKKSKVTRDKFECGACGGSEVFKQWEYCPWCGVRLDW